MTDPDDDHEPQKDKDKNDEQKPEKNLKNKDNNKDTHGRPEISEQNKGHIFDAKNKGHVSDTPAHRKILVDTASNPKNYIKTDKFGNKWYAKALEEGKQAWVRVKDGKITNGGINEEILDIPSELRHLFE